MQVDHVTLVVDCNTPALDPDFLPHCHNSTQIQRMLPIKESEIGRSWGIRLLTSTPFSKLKKTQTTKIKKAIHLGDHPAVYTVVKDKRVIEANVWDGMVIWATLIFALFDAAGVLVPAPRPPKAIYIH